MPSKIVKQKNFERNNNIIRAFCEEYNIDLVDLNDGYQLRLEDILDLYPVRARWHNIKTGERGDWNGYKDLKQLMLRTLDVVAPPIIKTGKFEDDVTVPFIADQTRKIAKDLTIRVEQQIRIVMKPKPRFLTEKMWMRLAAKFIYIEKTQPSFSLKGEQ